MISSVSGPARASSCRRNPNRSILGRRETSSSDCARPWPSLRSHARGAVRDGRDRGNRRRRPGPHPGEPPRPGRGRPATDPPGPGRVRPADFSATRSGRLELARWLTDPGHPLTSRVMVNRLWRGISARGSWPRPTTSRPSANAPSTRRCWTGWRGGSSKAGWSIKEIHRLIMLEYLPDEAPPTTSIGPGRPGEPAALAIQPSPARGRADPRCALAVGGMLDPAMGASLLQVKNREYFFDHTSKDLTDYDSRSAPSTCRLSAIICTTFSISSITPTPASRTGTGRRRPWPRRPCS